MYKVGDKVMHQKEGACFIKEITHMEVNETTKQYYILKPILDHKAIVYISMSPKHQSRIRPALASSDVAEAEMQVNDSPMEWMENSKERQKSYSKSISSFEFSDVLRVLRCMSARNIIKALGSQDQLLMQAAEKLVCSEIAIARDQTYEQVVSDFKIAKACS